MVEEKVASIEVEWRESAACLGHSALLFFGMDDSESPADRRGREEAAKRVCRLCDVKGECLDYALAAKEPYGIWGGLTELERRARLRSRTL